MVSSLPNGSLRRGLQQEYEGQQESGALLLAANYVCGGHMKYN
jgi:hypothetical protein